MQQKKLSVLPYVAEQMERFCQEPPGSGTGRGELLYDASVVFDSSTIGPYMVIQVIASETPEEEECWTQGVLFSKEGYELGTTDVGESFLGEYHVWDGDKEYVVDVVSE